MDIGLIWFRQDLRLADNPAFIEACSQHQYVIPLYIYDEKNSVLGEAQHWWLHHSLIILNQSLNKQRLNLILRKGDPKEILFDLINTISIEAVYWNRCYEPLIISRDKNIKAALLAHGIPVQTSNANLFHEPWTIKNKSGNYFKVFTPYWRHCRASLSIPKVKSFIHAPQAVQIPSEKLEDWDLLPTPNWALQFSESWTPGEMGAQQKLNDFIGNHLKGYKLNRDFPVKNASSRLSPHLHFGEISPWTILRALEQVKLNPNSDLASIEHFLSELGWREFSYYLLYHFPELSHSNFKSEFDAFPWQNDAHLLQAWQKGLTGYPIVDAGMKELWATGYMHNRVRMIVASFLTKGLLIDWRLGAKWFLNTLLDADLANNSASWQWVAGCGVDAAPYFRIFNPVLQSQKFDAEGSYIRQWLPELASLNNVSIHAPWEAATANWIYANSNYPKPIINHNEARAKALAYYQQLKAQE